MAKSQFEECFAAVQELVDRYQANEGRYESPEYQEAEVRKDFIDKLLIVLGWDVNHDVQTNPYEQEVKVEPPVQVGGSQRRADYAFYLAPSFREPKFFVEAKKPSSELATPDNCFQAIRYGWNGQTALGVLTNFKQFLILDCRYKPDIAHSADRDIETFHYTDYAVREKFSRLYWLFSREAVQAGSLEKRAQDLPKPRGRATQRILFPGAYKAVDEAFLEELNEHRTELARIFKKADPSLDGPALTEIAQRTLDRLVFIKFLEDRGIEPTQHIDHFGDSGSPWADFIGTSRTLDDIYNGVVFKRHPVLDSPSFKVDDDAFGAICEHLSTANTPYDFNSIPIHILGSIYEQFLGQIIVATDKRVRVEEKPEVRKAGGVYYTPEYVVREIVEHTVAVQIQDKTPSEISQMRFADISCGSGSFLLGLYDLLLVYHGRYYNQYPQQAKKGDCEVRDGRLYLSVKKKREILLNNVFGVDIDSQAVEVAQLSLFLKLLQDETPQTTHQYQLEFRHVTAQRKLLPDLSKNIVRGNSLIGTDILKGQFTFDAEHESDLSPVDFKDLFPDVMKRGGFDGIVGNPPYVRIQGFPKRQIEYLKDRYVAAVGSFDLYVCFVERGFSLLRKTGRLGYIVPNKFFATDYGAGLRELLSSNNAVDRIVDFGVSQVFEATTYTCLLFLSKKPQESFSYAESSASAEGLVALRFLSQPAASLSKLPWNFGDERTKALHSKLVAAGVRLLDLPAKMNRGSSTGADDVFLVPANSTLEPSVLRVPIFAADFSRYEFWPTEEWRVIFPYEVDADGSTLMLERGLKQRAPKAFAHLRENYPSLKKRKQFKEPYAFSAPRSLSTHEGAQIVVPLLANQGLCALIPANLRGKLCPMASGGFTITLGAEAPATPEYLIGILNSKLLFWALGRISNRFRGDWITCTKQYFGELPIHVPRPEEQSALSTLVREAIEARVRVRVAKTQKDKSYYEGKCVSMDRQIDQLVYQLYHLTEDEIALVENLEVVPVAH